jgi:hypothetical protein
MREKNHFLGCLQSLRQSGFPAFAFRHPALGFPSGAPACLALPISLIKWYYGQKQSLIALLTFSQFVVTMRSFEYGLLGRACETSPGKNAVFLSIYLSHLHRLIPCSYWTSTRMVALSSACALCDFCSSGQRFAAVFLQIPRHRGHPWPWLCTSRYRACSGLSPVRLRPCRAHYL